MIRYEYKFFAIQVQVKKFYPTYTIWQAPLSQFESIFSPQLSVLDLRTKLPCHRPCLQSFVTRLGVEIRHTLCRR